MPPTQQGQNNSKMLDLFKSLFGAGTDTEQLKDIVRNGAFLVDVRTPGEFASGHVKGSVNIPLDTIQNNLKAFKGKENIVVFCLSGGRSSQAKTILERNGIQNVINGGTWQQVRQLIG